MSAYEGGQNFQPDIPAERWKELYLEAAAEIERLRAAVAAERERCLRIVQSVNNSDNPMTANDCADLIAGGRECF